MGYTGCDQITSDVTSQCTQSGGCSELNYALTTAEVEKSFQPAAGIDSYRHVFAYVKELDCVLRSESLLLDSSLSYTDASSGNPNRVLRSRITTIQPDPLLASTAIQSGNLYLVKSTDGGLIVGDLTIADGSYQITAKELSPRTDSSNPGVRWPDSHEAIPRESRLEFLRSIPVTTARTSFLHLLCPSADNELSSTSVTQTNLGGGKQEVLLQRGALVAKVLVDPANDSISPVQWTGISPTPTPTATSTFTPEATATPTTPSEPSVKWSKNPKLNKKTKVLSGTGIIQSDTTIRSIQLEVTYKLRGKTIKKTYLVKERVSSDGVSFSLKVRLPRTATRFSALLKVILDQDPRTVWKSRL